MGVCKFFVFSSDEKRFYSLLLISSLRFPRSLSLNFLLCCERQADGFAVLQFLWVAMFARADASNSGQEVVA